MQLKFISLICMIILFVEAIYVGYHMLYKSEESIYFEGINAVIATSKYYVTVGSNNDNDNHYEKAKISRYNKRREKQAEKLYKHSTAISRPYFRILINTLSCHIIIPIRHDDACKFRIV